MLDGLYINRYKQAVLGFSVLFLVMFMIVTIMYALAISNFKAPSTWINWISVKCPVSEQLTELIFQDAVYVEYGTIFYIFGCYLGLIADAKNFKGTIV